MAFGMDITEYRYKLQRDYKNTIDTAFEAGKRAGRLEAKLEGKQEGRLEGKLEIAKNMKLQGMPVHLIAQLTGLSEEKIINL